MFSKREDVRGNSVKKSCCQPILLNYNYFLYKMKYTKRFLASPFCQYPIPNNMEFDNPLFFIDPFYFIASKHKK